MGGKRKKFDIDKNRRLDAFLTQLEIEKGKKEQILHYIQELTFDTLTKKTVLPPLRLKKS